MCPVQFIPSFPSIHSKAQHQFFVLCVLRQGRIRSFFMSCPELECVKYFKEVGHVANKSPGHSVMLTWNSPELVLQGLSKFWNTKNIVRCLVLSPTH